MLARVYPQSGRPRGPAGFSPLVADMSFLVSAISSAAVGVILFVAAGRLDLPYFWACVIVNFLVLMLKAGSVDSELLRERRRPGPGGVDRGLRFIMAPMYIAMLVVAGLDAGRFGWSRPPPDWLRIPATAVFGAGLWLVVRSMIVNRFFSPVVRIQAERGHHVIQTGPYRWVRHPGYLGVLALSPAISIALGSWWGLAPVGVILVLVVRRIRIEEQYLQENLQGYREYSQQVRFRVCPGVW